MAGEALEVEDLLARFPHQVQGGDAQATAPALRPEPPSTLGTVIYNTYDQVTTAPSYFSLNHQQ